MDNLAIWGKTRQILGQKISPALLKIWFSKVEILAVEKAGDRFKIILGFPNKFLTEQIEKRCTQQLIWAFEQALGEKVSLGLQVSVNNYQELIDGKNKTTPELDGSFNGKLEQDFDYTFESFVVGESNRLAYSAAKAVSASPGKTFNPLFIYGGTGVGKTHLLLAILNQLKKTAAALKAAYKTTEAFTNEFVEGLAANQIRLFREKYRRLGVLLIDDIQFLSGKTGTQDEFFHTFNELYSTHHQIILTSDRHPQELGRVEERLVSRFLGGLTVDIAPPELELKMAILRKKAKVFGLDLDNSVCQFLAETVTNPREIGGAVAAISQTVKLGGGVSLEAVKLLFNKKDSGLRVAPKSVVGAVAKFYKIKPAEITGKTRKAEVVRARQMVMFLLRTGLGFSYDFIGQILGARDHSTVIHGVERIQKQIGVSRALKDDLLEIKRDLFI